MASVQTEAVEVRRLTKLCFFAGGRAKHLHNIQTASATAAKSKATGKGSAVVAGSGTILLDLGTYKAKEIEDEFKKRRLSSRA